MPVHIWLPVPVGLYHHFHQSSAVILAESLNNDVLPAGYFALVDQRAIGLIPDVLALNSEKRSDNSATAESQVCDPADTSRRTARSLPAKLIGWRSFLDPRGCNPVVGP
jgi:hypothetical protein